MGLQVHLPVRAICSLNNGMWLISWEQVEQRKVERKIEKSKVIKR